MSLATLTSATDGAEFDLDPSAVESVARVTRPAGLPSVCVVVSRSGREYHVAGDLASVRAALRPPAPGVQDLEDAVRVLLVLADAVANCDEDDAVSLLTGPIAAALGRFDDSWGGVVSGLKRVAAKLGGGAR